MFKNTIWAALAVSALGISALAADVSSGLKTGEKAGFFEVVDVSGPNKGKQLCYR
jgi:hypothetical protein